MNNLQKYLLRAGRDLGIKVIAPFELKLPSGRAILADALLPELGAPKGTLVFRSDKGVCECGDEVKKLGFTYSSYHEPPADEVYDVDSYREMFIDWGWTSKEWMRPDWMN